MHRTGRRPVSKHSDFINGIKWVLSLSFAVVICYSASLKLGDMLFKVFKVLFLIYKIDIIIPSPWDYYEE